MLTTIHGHALAAAGAAFGENGKRLAVWQGKRITGKALCACGWLSADFPLVRQRKAAYAEGHPNDAENTRIDKRGSRNCRKCERRRYLAWRKRQAA